MDDRTTPVRLAYLAVVVAVAMGLAACPAPVKKKLPVCPGDPRCTSTLVLPD